MDTELVEHNDYLPKKASVFGSVQAFPIYGGLGMSTPALHREPTDSLMIITLVSLIFSSHKHGQDTVGSLARAYRVLAMLLNAISSDRRGAAGGARAGDVDYSACAKHKMATKTSGFRKRR